jgi:putative ribosome biogenesis GTPase RsgA
MGVTGAGKSYFINRLTGKNAVEEGESLDSCLLKGPTLRQALLIKSRHTALLAHTSADWTQQGPSD